MWYDYDFGGYIDMQEHECGDCGKQVFTTHTDRPRGWHVDKDAEYCRDCWHFHTHMLSEGCPNG